MRGIVAFGLALVSAGCGHSAVQPAVRSEQPTTPVRTREISPVMIVANPEVSPHIERWAPPARLIDQSVSSSDRSCERNREHDRVLRFDFDATGTRLVEWRSHAISVWVREPNAARWMQVLREPWQVRGVAWKKDRLTLCAEGPRGSGSTSVVRDPKGGLDVSLAGGPAEWVEAPGAACARDVMSSLQSSSNGRWRTVETVRTQPKCKPTMTRGSDCKIRTWEHILTIPGSPSKTLKGSGVTPAMSPSGRFFAFQEPDRTVTVYETATRKSRPTGTVGPRGESPSVLDMTWLPDESALAIRFSGGHLSFVSPETGEVTFAAGNGWSSDYLVLDPSTGAPLVRKNWQCDAPVVTPTLSVTLPGDADRTLRLPAARRTMSFGKGAWALWDEETGKVLRILGGVVSFEPSPSERFIAVLLDHCGKTLGCGGEVQVVDVASGATRWTLELPAVTKSSVVKWFGPASGEILAVVEKSAQYLRPSDGAILHAEPPTTANEPSPVLWTEGGLVDASAAELAAWAFRPAGHLDHVVAATLLHHPNLWNDFRDGRPLPAPSALNEGTKGP